MKGYRTIIFNVLASLLPIMDLTEVHNLIPETWLPWYAIAVAIGNVYLRSITTTPVGTKE